MRILAVSGSLRAASSNSLLLQAAARLAPTGCSVEFFHSLGDLPHFNPDIEHDSHPAITLWRNAVANADALLFSTPEYAHSIPGSLKNALDWLVGGTEIVGKPVAILNASPLSLYVGPALEQVLRAISADFRPEAAIKVNLRGRLRPDFDPATDPAYAAPIRSGLENLAAAIRARRSGSGQ